MQRISLPARYADATVELSGCDLSGTGDKAYFDIPFKCNVVYAAVVVTTAIAGTAVVKFDKRHAAGSDTGRTDGTVASITLPDLTAVGSMVYDKAAQSFMASDTALSTYTTAATCQAAGGFWDTANSKCLAGPAHPYGELEPGNEVVVQLISGTLGKVQPVLVVEVNDEVFANLENCSETA